MVENNLNSVNMLGLNTNLAASNKWFCYLPVENILGKNYNNIDLHLTRFSLPLMIMSSTTVSYKGMQKEIPTKVMNPDTKELTLEFIVDLNWQNYKALYAIMSSTEGNINKVVDDELEPITPDTYIDLRIYLLDNYKNKVIQFVFENAWLKIFNDISLEANNPNEVHASVTWAYDRFYIDDMQNNNQKSK